MDEFARRDSDDQRERRGIGGWLVVAVVWWALTCGLLTLSVAPAGFISAWPCLLVALGLSAWVAWISRRSSIRAFARRRALELSMLACVIAAIASAMFSMSLAGVLIWLVTGTSAFVLALVALGRLRRHPMRSLGVLAGYLTVLLLFLAPLGHPASKLGLKVRVAMVQSRYRPAAEELLQRNNPKSAGAGLMQDTQFRPSSGRVLAGARGEPVLVVWTWTSGLAINHPSGLVFDPQHHLPATRDFYQRGPDAISLKKCEPVLGEWWWCVLYD